ncbi:hypothetical protein FGB62_39g114 [Gracilaria domingensis]|nr:hypothetical protein FGB62_39g114 [Gracilaria domingensis]
MPEQPTWPILDNPKDQPCSSTELAFAYDGVQTAVVAALLVNQMVRLVRGEQSARDATPLANQMVGTAAPVRLDANVRLDRLGEQTALETDSPVRGRNQDVAVEVAHGVPGRSFSPSRRDSEGIATNWYENACWDTHECLCGTLEPFWYCFSPPKVTPRSMVMVQAFQHCLPKNQIGVKQFDLYRSQADPLGNEGLRYTYVPEPVGRTIMGPNGGVPGGGGPSGSLDEPQRKPKLGMKTERREIENRRRSGLDSSFSISHLVSSSGDEYL